MPTTFRRGLQAAGLSDTVRTVQFEPGRAWRADRAPKLSEQLDYEGELVAVIGKGGKNIPKAPRARSHRRLFDLQRWLDPRFPVPVAAMDGRQEFRQYLAFGPTLVTAEELPPGCLGLKIETRLNGRVIQSAMIDE